MKNPTLMQSIMDVINESKVTDDVAPLTGGLLVKLANFKNKHRPMLSQYVATRKIRRPSQLEAAIKYLKQNSLQDDIDVADFEQSCGVGTRRTLFFCFLLPFI